MKTTRIGIFLFSIVAIISLNSFINVHYPKLFAPTESINYFKGTFSEALAESKKTKRPVFIDAYADWCGWCKRLDATTFKDNGIISTLNEKFVVIKMNTEEGEGPGLASKFNITGLPTLLFLDENGKLLNTIEGYATAPELKERLAEVVKKYKKHFN